MRTKVEEAISFKDGTTWEKGTPVEIHVARETPWGASLKNLWTKDVKRVHSTKLYKWFGEFEPFGANELQEAVRDNLCPSLLGVDVEPDGWDSEGFPSILLAAGLV